MSYLGFFLSTKVPLFGEKPRFMTFIRAFSRCQCIRRCSGVNYIVFIIVIYRTMILPHNIMIPKQTANRELYKRHQSYLLTSRVQNIMQLQRQRYASRLFMICKQVCKTVSVNGSVLGFFKKYQTPQCRYQKISWHNFSGKTIISEK